MPETEEEYRRLVDQKMEARAVRNAALRQAEQEAKEQEVRDARAARGRDEQERQKRAQQVRQLEAAAEARRNRPALITQFKADPTGIRHIATLRHVCINCGSTWVRGKTVDLPQIPVCQKCRTEWYVNHCWSCTTGVLDSRDPETPPCGTCGRIKCAVCAACNPAGCSTNPYSSTHRHRDVAAA